MCLSRKPAQIMVFQITNSMQPFRLPALQNYEYISTIGEGTYGVVWKCRDKVSGRLVAVKAFKEAHRDRVALKLAVREAKVLSMIKHPNIVKMTASYRSKSGRLYLAGSLLDRCWSTLRPACIAISNVFLVACRQC
ncbi:hypothetical protein Vretimale_18791 [Volvox reticuliferus]|uniref:Protein kinase domain-containing protein n=1 Tax=Volvox reticuliferus TaxID=1737510 RepID=A0A8J4LYJ3_9CHLO|nr:hypothetical protein Vretimale_18791 [Volvox reticuliferus]